MEKFINYTGEIILDSFAEAGYEIYAVGGCVRDHILGIKPKDVDFCTSATPQQMEEVYNHMYVKTPVTIIPTGEKFGTLTFRFPFQNEQYEVTTYRREGRYTDGRHPNEVFFAKTLVEDLERRDFTCNAIAWNPITGYIDPFGGKQDIANRVIRCVGNPEERFNEDALRIIRLVRFAIRYNFEIDIDTYTAAKKLINNIDYVSKERVGAEFVRIFSYRYAINFKDSKNYKTYNLLAALLRKIFPNCQDDETVQDIILWDKVPLLRWYDACTDKDERKMMSFINQFAVGRDIANGVKNLSRAFTFLKSSDVYWKDKKVLGIVRTQEERRALLAKLIDSSVAVEDIVKAIVNEEPYSIEQLAVDGDWIVENFNISPGPGVKKMLEKALDIVCANPSANTEETIKESLLRSNT